MNVSEVWATLPPFIREQCTKFNASTCPDTLYSKEGTTTFIAVCTSHRYDAPMETLTLTPVTPGRTIQQNGGNVDDDIRLQAALKSGRSQDLFDALGLAVALGHNLATFILTTTLAVASWSCDVKQLRTLFGLKPEDLAPGEADLLFRQFGCTESITGLADRQYNQ